MGRIMKPLTEKIKWPWWMEIFSLCGFYIDSDTLQLLNFHESGLERIYIRGGNVKNYVLSGFQLVLKISAYQIWEFKNCRILLKK